MLGMANDASADDPNLDQWPPDTSGPAPGADVEELASFYRYLADAEFDGYCDLYAVLARAIADDRALLDRVVTLAPAAKVIPILLFAAVHDLVLADPDAPLAAIYRGGPGDPWPAFRSVLDERFDELATLVANRTIQTNEVGRAAVLVPALRTVHHATTRPLALVEIGPSAGLNLLLDRFGYRYGLPDGTTLATGDPASPVQLTCEVRGPLSPPLHTTAPPIASRQGIDLSPVDVTDPVACRWLEACVWPLVPDRADRLRAALDLARRDVPLLHRGGALDLLVEVIGALPDDVVPVVLSTWVLAYFSPDDRLEVGRVLDAIGATRDLALITGEYPSIAPFVDRPDRDATGKDGQGASLLGRSTWIVGNRESRPIAWTHAHGRWIDWLDEPSSAGPSGADT